MQSGHRREIEKIVIVGDQKRAYYGLACGTFVAISAMAVCGAAIFHGHPIEGLTGVLGTIATLAGVFVYGTNSRKKERLERARAQVPTTDAQRREGEKLN